MNGSNAAFQSDRATAGPRPAAARRRGFTLLEVMVALGIFLAGVVGILGLFASGLAMHRNATRNTIVAQASEDVRVRVERFVRDAAAADGDAPVLDPLERVAIPGQPGYFYDATFVADDEHGLEGGVMATVHVYALDAGRERGQTFTLFTRPRAGPEAFIRRAKTP